MSNYERNPTMVICIIAVIAVGAITIGLLGSIGTMDWRWNTNQEIEYFGFDDTVGTTSGPVVLDVELTTGSISITFEDNASLLYRFSLAVSNATIELDGAPSVSFAAGRITLDYTTAAVNITLGSGLNYTIDASTTTGSISAIFDDNAHFGDVDLSATTGSISVIMTDDVSLYGSTSMVLDTETGSISAIMDFPTGVEGRFQGTTGIGTVDVTAIGWLVAGTNTYETSDYASATTSLTITATTSTGSISATIT